MEKGSSSRNRTGHLCCSQQSAGEDDLYDAPKTLMQLIHEVEQEKPLVEYRDGEFVFYDEDRHPYVFDACRADTHAKLLEWIRHMTEKVWVTGLHINQFIRLAAKHLPQIKIKYSA
jgi:hypothetical protein